MSGTCTGSAIEYRQCRSPSRDRADDERQGSAPRGPSMGGAQRFVAVAQMDDGVGRAAESHRRLGDRLEHRLHVGRRTGDDLQDVGRGRLPLQRRLGGVARGADRRLRPPALGDVAVDQHEAATRHGVAAHFDHRPVGARALEPQLAVGVARRRLASSASTFSVPNSPRSASRRRYSA